MRLQDSLNDESQQIGKNRYNYHIKMDFENKEIKKIEKGVQEVKSNENEQIYIILSFPYTFTFLSRSE